MNILMVEYAGELSGGPDDGNLVTSSVTEIPVVSTTEMWLDGIGNSKTISILEKKGIYAWNPETESFIWMEISNTMYSKKVEAV